jgi:hypothetical protein
MIRMYPDLSPDQMQVVSSRQFHRQHSDRVGRVIRYVEIVLWRLEIPAVTHFPGQHLGDHGERIGVVDLPRRLQDAGDCGHLSKVVRLEAYERHPFRVTYPIAVPPLNFETTL